jgi:hypothetical protein
VIEQRQSARKIFKVKAVVAMEGRAPVLGHTTDIGANGVSITVPDPLQAGQAGLVSFDLLVDGKSVPLRARSKVMYSILSHGEFKIGFQFLHLDLAAMSQLTRFLR